jgi:hypothetical protein
MRTRTITSYGVTLTEAKYYLRVDTTDEDSLIDSLCTASYEQVTAECNRDFLPATYSLNIFSSSGDLFLSTQTVNSASLGTLNEVNGTWFSYVEDTYTGPLVFTVADSGSVPNGVKVAQLMLVANWFENRGPAVENRLNNVPYAVEALLSPYKLIKP